MGYIDEEILRQQLIEKKREEENENTEGIIGNVTDGKVIINGTEFLFSKHTFLDGRFTIYMPDDLREMTKEEIEGNYILGNRPQFLYTSDSLELSFAMNHTNNPLIDAQVPDMAEIAMSMLERIKGNVKFYKKEKREINNKIIYKVEAVTSGIDDSVFTFNLYASLAGRLLLTNISFGARKMATLHPLIMQMFDTLEIFEEV